MVDSARHRAIYRTIHSGKVIVEEHTAVITMIATVMAILGRAREFSDAGLWYLLGADPASSVTVSGRRLAHALLLDGIAEDIGFL